MEKKEFTVTIPADVPHNAHKTYTHNYNLITKNTGNLMLFACDQKMEHLNTDFYGPNIHLDALYPEHIFSIASQGRISALATHLGLIAHYGEKHKEIPYIVKLNGKTNLSSSQDPISEQLWSVDDIISFQKTSGLTISGVGYTIYLGSSHEHIMLKQAAQIIHQAHENGLIAIIWIYLRGSGVAKNHNEDLFAGATGVAASLGADFVKIKPPTDTKLLHVASRAAGKTGVICSGGESTTPDIFLQRLYNQLHTGGARGCATGRNIFQNSLPEAIAWTQAISALVFDGESYANSLNIYKKHLIK